jgi:hypothetical protein
MGVLQLIKIHRISITTFHIVEDVVEYDENGLEMMFKLNPNFVAGDITQSEFDTSSEEGESEKKEDEKK